MCVFVLVKEVGCVHVHISDLSVMMRYQVKAVVDGFDFQIRIRTDVMKYKKLRWKNQS